MKNLVALLTVVAGSPEGRARLCELNAAEAVLDLVQGADGALLPAALMLMSLLVRDQQAARAVTTLGAVPV